MTADQSVGRKDHFEAAVSLINRGGSDRCRALKDRVRSVAKKMTRLVSFKACHRALLVAVSAAVAAGRKGRALPRGLCRWRSEHRGLPPKCRAPRKFPAVMLGPQPREPQRRLRLSVGPKIPILARSIDAGRFSRHRTAHRSCRSKFQPKAICDKSASAPEKRNGPESVRPCGETLESRLARSKNSPGRHAVPTRQSGIFFEQIPISPVMKSAGLVCDFSKCVPMYQHVIASLKM